jgi:hypothetical protein
MDERTWRPPVLLVQQTQGGEPARKDAKAILDAARAKSGAYAQLVAALRGPDPSVRATVFDEMVNSGDGTLRTLAIETGFASDDSVLRALALKYSIASSRSLNMRLLPSENISEQTGQQIMIYGTISPVVIERTDPNTGSFSGTFCVSGLGNTHPNCKASGQVQGLSVSVASTNCSFSGTLTSEQKIVGVGECQLMESLPAEMIFR